jgi:hypothetical protein
VGRPGRSRACVWPGASTRRSPASEPELFPGAGHFCVGGRAPEDSAALVAFLQRRP